MSSKLRVSHELGGEVDRVYAMLTDPAFLERKFAALEAKDIRVEVSGAGDEKRVVIHRKVTVDLPGFATKFLQPTNSVVQTEEWSAPGDDGRRVCRYGVEVQGVPSRIDGTVTLVPAGAVTRQEIEADVKVSIPLVGGKLEKLAVDNAVTMLRDEADFTNRDLAAG